jgi:hypothetical protein
MLTALQEHLMKNFKKLLIGVTAVALLLGACGSDDSSAETVFSDSAGEFVEPSTEESAAGAPASLDGASVAGQESIGDSKRKIITNVDFSVVAEDPEALYDSIVAIATAGGGYVSNAQISYPSGEEDSDPFISMTLRIPASDVDSALSTIEAMADRVVHRNVFTSDVTEQYTDLEARIGNLELLETELQTLLTEVRSAGSSDTEDLIRVFNEISRVRGDLELLEGRRRLLADQVDLATVQVSIQPKSDFIPFVDEWKPLQVAKSALTDLGQWLKNLVDFIIRFVLVTGPVVVLMIGIGFYLVWRPLRWAIAKMRIGSGDGWRKKRPEPADDSE